MLWVFRYYLPVYRLPVLLTFPGCIFRNIPFFYPIIFVLCLTNGSLIINY